MNLFHLGKRFKQFFAFEDLEKVSWRQYKWDTTEETVGNLPILLLVIDETWVEPRCFVFRVLCLKSVDSNQAWSNSVSKTHNHNFRIFKKTCIPSLTFEIVRFLNRYKVILITPISISLFWFGKAVSIRKIKFPFWEIFVFGFFKSTIFWQCQILSDWTKCAKFKSWCLFISYNVLTIFMTCTDQALLFSSLFYFVIQFSDMAIKSVSVSINSANHLIVFELFLLF